MIDNRDNPGCLSSLLVLLAVCILIGITVGAAESCAICIDYARNYYIR